MKRITKFDKPTQVRFYDRDSGCYIIGIGYGEEVICGCSGDVFKIDEVEPIVPLEWTDIDAIIRGDW